MSLTPAQYFEMVPPTVDMTIRSELFHTNEFNFAVAVILSAQATDKKVNEVTPALFSVAPTPEKMLALGLDGLKEHIRVISFFNNKATGVLGKPSCIFPRFPGVTLCSQGAGRQLRRTGRYGRRNPPAAGHLYNPYAQREF